MPEFPCRSCGEDVNVENADCKHHGDDFAADPMEAAAVLCAVLDRADVTGLSQQPNAVIARNLVTELMLRGWRIMPAEKAAE